MQSRIWLLQVLCWLLRGQDSIITKKIWHTGNLSEAEKRNKLCVGVLFSNGEEILFKMGYYHPKRLNKTSPWNSKHLQHGVGRGGITAGCWTVHEHNSIILSETPLKHCQMAVQMPTPTQKENRCLTYASTISLGIIKCSAKSPAMTPGGWYLVGLTSHPLTIHRYLRHLK